MIMMVVLVYLRTKHLSDYHGRGDGSDSYGCGGNYNAIDNPGIFFDDVWNAPHECNGSRLSLFSALTTFSDYHWTVSGFQMRRSGGSWNSSKECGFVADAYTDISTVDIYQGSRLSKN